MDPRHVKAPSPQLLEEVFCPSKSSPVIMPSLKWPILCRVSWCFQFQNQPFHFFGHFYLYLLPLSLPALQWGNQIVLMLLGWSWQQPKMKITLQKSVLQKGFSLKHLLCFSYQRRWLTCWKFPASLFLFLHFRRFRPQILFIFIPAFQINSSSRCRLWKPKRFASIFLNPCSLVDTLIVLWICTSVYIQWKAKQTELCIQATAYCVHNLMECTAPGI